MEETDDFDVFGVVVEHGVLVEPLVEVTHFGARSQNAQVLALVRDVLPESNTHASHRDLQRLIVVGVQEFGGVPVHFALVLELVSKTIRMMRIVSDLL